MNTICLLFGFILLKIFHLIRLRASVAHLIPPRYGVIVCCEVAVDKAQLRVQHGDGDCHAAFVAHYAHNARALRIAVDAPHTRHPLFPRVENNQHSHKLA